MLWLVLALAGLGLVAVPASDEFTVSGTVHCPDPDTAVPTVDWAIRSNVDYEGVVAETHPSQRYSRPWSYKAKMNYATTLIPYEKTLDAMAISAAIETGMNVVGAGVDALGGTLGYNRD